MRYIYILLSGFNSTFEFFVKLDGVRLLFLKSMAHIPKPRSTFTSRTDARTFRRGAKRYTIMFWVVSYIMWMNLVAQIGVMHKK